MAERFYAVAFGYNRGIYLKWEEAQQAMKGFPSAVFKKFNNRQEAEQFVAERQPIAVLFQVTQQSDKFFAVARGRIIGIFDNLDVVKNHIKDHPQPLYKKFSTYLEAKAYFDKYANGIVDAAEVERKNQKAKAKQKEPAFYAVARGYNPGVYATWPECQTQIEGFKGARFKKFTTDEEAQNFIVTFSKPDAPSARDIGLARKRNKQLAENGGVEAETSKKVKTEFDSPQLLQQQQQQQQSTLNQQQLVQQQQMLQQQ